METLNQKLLAIQEEIGGIKKSKKNPYFNSNYFDINALLEAVKPVLNKHKVVLLQPMSESGLQTILVDVESNEKIESTCVLPQNPDAQKMGAIITYFRRYMLTSLLALEAEDTDANDTAVAQVTAHIKPLPPIPEGMQMQSDEVVLCSTCGGIMEYRQGMSKPGKYPDGKPKPSKPFKGYFCTVDKEHSPIWL